MKKAIKRLIALCCLAQIIFTLASCSQRPLMTKEQFYSYSIGQSISSVIDVMGRPDLVQEAKKGDGKEYIYIDRIEVSRDITEHTQYIFNVENGHIRDKEIRQIESTYPEMQINPFK